MMVNNGVAITVPDVKDIQGVMAFSVRTGGQSPPPLDSLNFSVTQGDSQENVRHNLSVFCSSIDVAPNSIATCRQIHSDRIVVIEKVPDSAPLADAIVSVRPGVFPAVKTADCVPILLLDPINRVSAAVHAGWRGTVLGITSKVVRFMTDEFGTEPSRVIASLGPAIGPCCYEVDDAVLVPFRENVQNAERFIHVKQVQAPGTSYVRESRRLDLEAANHAALIGQGISDLNVHRGRVCTCCDSSRFFSYRRDGARSGRHIAVVGFMECDV